MGTIINKTIQGWADLAEELQRYREKGYLFRGQSNAKHQLLIPKVGRVDKAPGAARKYDYLPADEERVFKNFKKAARPYLMNEPKTEIEWLAVAQHHGLPTRLLDWTESLFVAAYFAVEKTQTNGAVFCVRDISEIGSDAEEKIFQQSEVLMYHPPHISPRITAQQSVFTLHPNPDQPFEHPTLERWVIAQKACWDIKRSLSAAGITQAGLFPGIDGLSQYLGWQYKWGFFEKGRTKRDPRLA
jgi:hypothetical protein